MTIFACKCGARKTGQPYKRADEKPWVCDKCAGKGRIEQRHAPKEPLKEVKPKHRIFG